jgi:hypothetical protein
LYPHPIRLHGPWDYEVLSGETAGARSGRVKLPCDWGATLGREFRGCARYRRSFHRPSGLEPHEHVWLVCEGADARAEVRLNGQSLGPIRGYALHSHFEITALIEERNEVLLDVELSDGINSSSQLRPGREHLPGGPIGEVRLEVRSGQFLDRWGLWIENIDGRPTLQLAGQVHSESAGESLELVLRSSDGELLYAPATFGSPLSLSAPADGLPFWSPREPRVAQIELRLIRAGTRVWQSHITMAVPAIAGESAGRAMLPLDDPDQLPAFVRSVSQQTAEQRPLVLLRSILPPVAYPALDAAGVEAIQCLPVAWAEEVALRLAHHPSLTAWLCECPPVDGQSRLFGKPCVPLASVSGQRVE